MNFISIYSNLLNLLLIEDYEQGAQGKELIFGPFVEQFKNSDFEKVLLINFISTYRNLLENVIFA